MPKIKAPTPETGLMKSQKQLEVLNVVRPTIRDLDGNTVEAERIVGRVLGLVGEVTVLKGNTVYSTVEQASAAIASLKA